MHQLKTVIVAVGMAIVGLVSFMACQGYIFIEEPKHQTGTQRNFIPIETISKADILFLVDNSGSMSQEQRNLAENFKIFIEEVLKGQNDFHIGIVTTEVLTSPLNPCQGSCNGGLDCIPATSVSVAVEPGNSYCTKVCEVDGDCPNYDCDEGGCTPSVCGKILGFDSDKKYCHPMTNGRLRYNPCTSGVCEYSGDHAKVLTNKVKVTVGDDDFQAMFRDNVKVGTNGSGFEKGLLALRNALDPEYIDPVTGQNLIEHENLGFYRPEARLTLIVVSDEEDCSYLQFDPEFNNDKVPPDSCYPNPNTCHPDCAPVEAVQSSSCLPIPGWLQVAALDDSSLVTKGAKYCMFPCDTTADCTDPSTVPYEGWECTNVDGFGSSQKYCNCNFIQSKSNPSSLYHRLIPTADYIEFFKSLKKDPNDVNMAVIIGAKQSGAGQGNPENCSSANGVACAGRRYYEVASGMTKYLSDSICQKDFQATLVKIAGTLIVSNERVLSDVPLDPTCIQVKVGGSDIPHCKINPTPCSKDSTGAVFDSPLCAGGEKCTDKDGTTCKPYEIFDSTKKCLCGDRANNKSCSTCSESNNFCEKTGVECRDSEGTGDICDCTAISDPDKKCKCLSSGKTTDCLRPIFWQYKPPTCSTDQQPKIIFNGCGLEAGDKLEINFLSGSTTTDADAGVTCE